MDANVDLCLKVSRTVQVRDRLGISREERRRFWQATRAAPDEDALPGWAKDLMRRGCEEYERLQRRLAAGLPLEPRPPESQAPPPT
jgi:hypothetical protein